MCGIPRSGTSLLAAALYQPPRVVTVMEPWDGLRLPPASLFDSIRQEIRDSGSLGRGRLDVNRLIASGRVVWGRDGEFPHDLTVDVDHLLGVKWPTFWRYLHLLPSTKFLVCVRDPVSVVRSFEQQPGSLSRGLEYDVTFNRKMNQELKQATADEALRRVLLYEYVASRIVRHVDQSNVFLVRYERWFSDAPALLHEISEFLGEDVTHTKVVVDERERRVASSDRDVELIATHCPSAQALGYTVPEPRALMQEM